MLKQFSGMQQFVTVDYYLPLKIPTNDTLPTYSRWFTQQIHLEIRDVTSEFDSIYDCFASQ